MRQGNQVEKCANIKNIAYNLELSDISRIFAPVETNQYLKTCTKE